MSEMVTVKCWKCGGSGRFALGTCFGCDGAGTNTYSAAYVARREAAAAGRRTAQQRRNEEAQAKRDAELAALSLAEMVEEVREMCMVGHDGLVEAFVEGSDTEIERVTVEEMARRLLAK